MNQLSDLTRKFNAGRQSELLLNEQLYKMYESIKHLTDTPDGLNAVPEAKLDGSIWLDRKKNELNYYDKSKDKWINVFANKFKITNEMMSLLPPDNPVIGELWIYNDVIMYYDGSQWKPTKAAELTGSQFNMSIFENFLLISPLWKIGGTAVEDDDLKAYEEAEKQYIQGKIDALNNADSIGDGSTWKLGDVTNTTVKDIGDLQLTGYSQMILPNIDVDRMFIDNKVDFNYQEVNKVCIKYEREYILNKTPTLIHVNPGRITKIKKRLIKIDRLVPKIFIPAANTEYYGFRKNEYFGRFLLPDNSEESKDYTIQSDGIYLSYNACQTYDFVLAVTYEFSWFKSTGTMKKSNNQESASSYYVQDYISPLNVFVDGYNLEDPYFTEDNLSQTITTTEDTSKNEISVMHSAKREYGFIRQVDLQGRGVVKTVHAFKQPLIFVNGEAVHPALGGVEVDGNTIYVMNAGLNMAWSAVELADVLKNYDMYYDAALVTKINAGGVPIIEFDNTKIAADDGVVLFIDGMLVKKEEIIRDDTNGTLTTANLKVGQDYILLKDKYHNLYDEKKLFPALAVGKLSETLVYFNGYLICNDTAIVTIETKEELVATAAHNEVKMFMSSDADKTVGEYCIYNMTTEKWEALSAEDIQGITYFGHSYENSLRAVKINIPYTKADIVSVFAFNYANAIEQPLIIRNVYIEDTDTVTINETYVPRIGSLSVFCDGIRQYYINEFLDGSGFKLANKFTGNVTYIIENPEDGKTVVCEREVLGVDNIVNDTPNVYKTTVSLYPGRITVYASGMRMPAESWSLLSNNMIMFNDKTKVLTGNSKTYPNSTVMKSDGTLVTYPIKRPDDILIEVRQEFMRKEVTFNWSEPNNWEIGLDKYQIPFDILDCSDEILIFINGVFTGMRTNIGYIKNVSKGTISIQDSSVISMMCVDKLYTAIVSDQELRLAWKEKYGTDIKQNINNKITLEWR